MGSKTCASWGKIKKDIFSSFKVKPKMNKFELAEY